MKETEKHGNWFPHNINKDPSWLQYLSITLFEYHAHCWI